MKHEEFWERLGRVAEQILQKEESFRLQYPDEIVGNCIVSVSRTISLEEQTESGFIAKMINGYKPNLTPIISYFVPRADVVNYFEPELRKVWAGREHMTYGSVSLDGPLGDVGRMLSKLEESLNAKQNEHDAMKQDNRRKQK